MKVHLWRPQSDKSLELARRHAFTLVELLVVIAVNSILAALLFPVLSNAKYSARNAVCRSNLRQISIGINLYTSTHGCFPPVQGFWGSYLQLPITYIEGTNFYREPLTYRCFGGVFRCPLNQGAVRTLEYGIGSGQPVGSHEEVRRPAWTAYGYNGFGGGKYFYIDGLGLAGFAPWPGVPPSGDFLPYDPVPTRETAVISRGTVLCFIPV